MRVGLAQNSVQRRYDGHAQIAQQRQDVAARPSAEDAVFVLQAYEVHVIDIQKVRRPAIGSKILFGQLEAHASRIGIAAFDVVDRHCDASRIRVFGGDGLTQVGGERGDAALSRQIVADESDAVDSRCACTPLHKQPLFFWTAATL